MDHWITKIVKGENDIFFATNGKNMCIVGYAFMKIFQVECIQMKLNKGGGKLVYFDEPHLLHMSTWQKPCNVLTTITTNEPPSVVSQSSRTEFFFVPSIPFIYSILCLLQKFTVIMILHRWAHNIPFSTKQQFSFISSLLCHSKWTHFDLSPLLLSSFYLRKERGNDTKYSGRQE